MDPPGVVLWSEIDPANVVDKKEENNNFQGNITGLFEHTEKTIICEQARFLEEENIPLDKGETQQQAQDIVPCNSNEITPYSFRSINNPPADPSENSSDYEPPKKKLKLDPNPITPRTRPAPSCKKVVFDPKIIKQLLISSNCLSKFQNWTDYDFANRAYKRTTLLAGSAEYKRVQKHFRSYCYSKFISQIENIQSPYLYLQYKLKAEQTKFTPWNMYHGTFPKYIDSICTHNFDWRRSGKSKGTKFGKGVSFSPDSFFSSHFGQDVMFMANVLVGRSHFGCKSFKPNDVYEIPREGYDATDDKKDKVYVKYDDAHFFPKYLIHYEDDEEEYDDDYDEEDDYYDDDYDDYDDDYYY